MSDGEVTLFLCGDVMLGRGVDQILAHPGHPTLREGYLQDARAYVGLAEDANGPIPAPVEAAWPWGESLAVLDEAAPEVRVVNLETSVTTSDDFAPRKRVHYRMHPDNVGALTVARPDVCVLANNHVMDFGVAGLEETLEVLGAAGLASAGAGRSAAEARAPVPVPLDDGGRVVVFAVGMASSGVPHGWAAEAGDPGVAFLPDASDVAAAELANDIHDVTDDGDIVVVSIHWGSNWGYEVPSAQVRFAHALVETGVVDVVHGHSSHHPRPIEVHRDRLILYGCGDLINDYEGIRGHERYRDDLRLLYLPTVDRASGALRELRVVPMQARRMRLEHASSQDRRWLRGTLDRVSQDLGTSLELAGDGDLAISP